MNPKETSFLDAVETLCSADGRYRREAYVFVVAALGATVQGLPAERLDDPIRRHLTGRELLLGMVTLARNEFGELAATVFGEWGIRNGEDVGRIVFQLVESGQLSARPEDSMEDFRGEPDPLAMLGGSSGPGPERRPLGPRRSDLPS